MTIRICILYVYSTSYILCLVQTIHYTICTLPAMHVIHILYTLYYMHILLYTASLIYIFMPYTPYNYHIPHTICLYYTIHTYYTRRRYQFLPAHVPVHTRVRRLRPAPGEKDEVSGLV